jgi:mono/diheme cytochrome c family protein
VKTGWKLVERHQSARLRPGGLILLLAFALAGVVEARAQSDWTIPDDAATLTSPLTVNADVLKRGGDVFKSRCRKCHGPAGKGDGPDSDPDQPAADLTLAEVGRTPDGILFFKVWNGRRPMPAFKVDLEKKDVWSVVAYVKSLSGVGKAQ